MVQTKKEFYNINSSSAVGLAGVGNPNDELAEFSALRIGFLKLDDAGYSNVAERLSPGSEPPGPPSPSITLYNAPP